MWFRRCRARPRTWINEAGTVSVRLAAVVWRIGRWRLSWDTAWRPRRRGDRSEACRSPRASVGIGLVGCLNFDPRSERPTRHRPGRWVHGRNLRPVLGWVLLGRRPSTGLMSFFGRHRRRRRRCHRGNSMVRMLNPWGGHGSRTFGPGGWHMGWRDPGALGFGGATARLELLGGGHGVSYLAVPARP